jgi:hypothetical protein
VGLAGSGSADKEDVFGPFHELTPMQLAQESFVDLAGSKIEPRQVFVDREAGGLDLISDRSDLPFSGFRFEQLGENGDGGVEGRRSLLMRSLAAWVMPYIFRLRSMMITAVPAGS